MRQLFVRYLILKAFTVVNLLRSCMVALNSVVWRWFMVTKQLHNIRQQCGLWIRTKEITYRFSRDGLGRLPFFRGFLLYLAAPPIDKINFNKEERRLQFCPLHDMIRLDLRARSINLEKVRRTLTSLSTYSTYLPFSHYLGLGRQ